MGRRAGIALTLSLLLALSLLLPGCGPAADGDRAGLKSYEPPGGQYRIHYRKPPWKLLEPEEGETPDGPRAVLRIESNAEKFGSDASVPNKYELTIDVRGGSARNLAQRAARVARRRGQRVLVEPRRIEDDEGALRGWETITVQDAPPSQRFRFSFLERDGGGVVSVTVAATPQLDDPEMDEMISLIEVDPESE